MRHLLWLVLLTGCAVQKPPPSALYQVVAGPQEYRFKAAKPGVAMSDIRAAERLSPLYDDAFGLVYADSTKDGHRVTVEYYQLNLRHAPRLRTLVVNVRCTDEAALLALMDELSAYFSTRYTSTEHGGPWQGAGLRTELRLWPDRGGLTLNVSRDTEAR